MKLLVIDVETFALGLASIDEDLFATIAAEVGLAACKLVGRNEALVLATMAIDVLLGIGRFLQQVFEERSLFGSLFDMAHCKERTTKSAHQFRFVATTYLSL